MTMEATSSDSNKADGAASPTHSTGTGGGGTPAGKSSSASALPMKKRKSLHLEPSPSADAVPSAAKGAKIKKTRHGSLFVEPSKQLSAETNTASMSALSSIKNKVKDEPPFLVSQADPSAVAKSNEIASFIDNSNSNNSNSNTGLTPQINDVLMVMDNQNQSPSIFHHIGNRRFRVLVEANLSGYFSEMNPQQLLTALFLADEDITEPISEKGEKVKQAKSPHSYSSKQSQVAEALIKSIVQMGVPAGRFLVQMKIPQREQNCSGSEEEDTNGVMVNHANGHDHNVSQPGDCNWKLATKEEIISKVHSTFLAAGRFHIKQNKAAMIALNGAQGTSSEEETEEEAAKEAATEMMDVDSIEIAATISHTSLNSSASSISSLATTKPCKENETFLNNKVDDHLLRIQDESTMKIQNYGLQSQGSELRSLPNIVTNYLPSRSSNKNRAVVAEAAATSPPAARFLINNRLLPSSIDELYSSSSPTSSTTCAKTSVTEKSPLANSSGPPMMSNDELFALSQSSGATSPLTSNRTSSDGSISPCPATATAVSLPKNEAAEKRQENDRTKAVGLKSELKNDVTMDNNSAAGVNAITSLLADITPVSFQCPTRIKVFLALPMDRFFIEEEERVPSATVMPSPSSLHTIIPSNYDMLCGPGNSFFHHVGNRRFRIMIEMNAQRYEQAYLASSVSPNAPDADDGSSSSINAEGEVSIQKLVDEILHSLSKCDPPGRFLGMEMSTGRWRLLNPVFAQLKTEQTFFECLQVKQKRHMRLQLELEEECKLQCQAEKENFKCQVEREKEILLEELDGRMEGFLANSIASAAEERRGVMAAAPQHQLAPAPAAQPSRTMSQSSLSEASSCPTAGVCHAASAIRNGLPSLAALSATNSNDTNQGHHMLSTLQSQAKALLRRRQSSSSTPLIVGSSNHHVAYNLSNKERMDIIVQGFAQEQLDASSRNIALLSQLQHATANNASNSAAAALPLQEVVARRCSFPILSTQPLTSLPDCPFSSSGNSSFSRMPKRGSNFSCDSHDSLQSAAGHQQSIVALPSSPSMNSGNGVKDLLDVVGGMMMMSRRSSC
eukprot:CAMPEP_0172322280 /NCGR_PEP_ID=MMETSP1058-20130122/45490_1 /TAXON_ID=83371 /ORGANISM="Detonula confervacea, Strain CCMP 353" /LENGTH=1070 /DNA_ID=CAMNT_0013037983 /DNA_START=26 /DNA_END=3238 /DNA_ORIENTATION=-